MTSQNEQLSTEEKIIEAARKVFIMKGYAATKTRDIAEEAQINIASLHYYYRSKDKLFQLVIRDAMVGFMGKMESVFTSELPFKDKVTHFVSNFTDFLIANPHVPNFIFSEIQRNPETMNNMMGDRRFVNHLRSELEEMCKKGEVQEVNPIQFIINLLGLTVFPFLGRPMIMIKTGINEEEFLEILEERKTLVPKLLMQFLGME